MERGKGDVNKGMRKIGSLRLASCEPPKKSSGRQGSYETDPLNVVAVNMILSINYLIFTLLKSKLVGLYDSAVYGVEKPSLKSSSEGE